MLEVSHLCLQFHNFTLQDITFEIDNGETFAIIGPSGSGKSCILKIIAGVYRSRGGEVRLHGQCIHHLPPEDRNIGLVMQNASLFSTLNVYENIAFGLKIRKTPKQQIRHKVDEYAELLQIGDLLNCNVNTLSGGEKQRVALARALIIEPRLLLLDEPFSALDRLIHSKLLVEFKHIFQLKQVTVLLVTHDQSEASYLARRIAIIRNGRILQIDTPANIFNKPNCRYVADFVNIPNIFEGTAVKTGQSVEIVSGTMKLKCDTLSRYGVTHFCIRPEHISLFSNHPHEVNDNIFTGIITDCHQIESVQQFTVAVHGRLLTAVRLAVLDNPFQIGDQVSVYIPQQAIHQLVLD